MNSNKADTDHAGRHAETGTDSKGHTVVPDGDTGETDLRRKIREILSQHGRLAGGVVQLSDTSDLHHAGLTSLATVGLMLALEEEFGIEFPDAMLSRRTFASINSLATAVAALRMR